MQPAVPRGSAVWIAAATVAACSSAANDVVPASDIASVSIMTPATTVTVGSQISLQALVQDANGRTIPGVEVFWSVQDPGIATVSSIGVVTGVALGSTQVAANVSGKSGTATITVERTPVSSVVVTPQHADAAPGAQTQFAATAYDAAHNALTDREITWSSSNTAVATVDANGVASAVSAGTATITATSEGRNGAATITVSRAAVATVAIAPTPLSMSVGQTTQLAATLKDAAGNVLNGRVVSWSSSNTAAAGVSPQGVVTAVAKGTATITATSEGKSGTADVTVTNVAVGSVTVQPQGPSVVVGSTVQLAATVRDVNGNVVTDRSVTWSSSNSAVAAVTASGFVTGVAAGSATITATSEGKSGTATVKVTGIPVGSVTVSPASKTMVVTETLALSVTVKDSLGAVVTDRAVSWSSSNANVATVSSAGVVTAVGAGAATITATSEGKTGTSAITVVAPVATVTVTPATKTNVAGETTPFTATAKDASGNVLTGRTLVWSSSNTGVATVSSTGVATSTGVGVTTITATAPVEGKSGAATLTVTAASVSVTPSPDSTYIGQTTGLTAIARDKNGNPVPAQGFSWSSNSPSIAAVSQSGVVSGVAAGSATIVAALGAQSGQASFKVLAPVATVTVSPSSPPAIAKNDNIVLQATLKDASNGVIGPGRVVTWSTTDTTGIVSITPTPGTYSATVKGKKAGTVTITATSEGKTGTATVTVQN